jgi:hypothetical protein
MALTSALYAQQSPTTPRERDVYCSGVVTTELPPSDTFVVSGVESGTRITFFQSDLVFINRGSNQGMQVGTEFLVSRPVHEPLRAKWFSWQNSLLRAMGTTYADIGRIRVINVQPNTSTAEVVYSCDLMQRGDIVEPFTARVAPPYKPATDSFDIFAPPSGKEQAMVVTTRGFGQLAGTGTIVYVNLGSAQGVRIGDYFRVFRYQGERHSTVYQSRGMEHSVWGMGSAPGAWSWADLPRDVLGEGIVLRVGPNASTVLITTSRREIFPGDYVELE